MKTPGHSGCQGGTGGVLATGRGCGCGARLPCPTVPVAEQAKIEVNGDRDRTLGSIRMSGVREWWSSPTPASGCAWWGRVAAAIPEILMLSTLER